MDIALGKNGKSIYHLYDITSQTPTDYIWTGEKTHCCNPEDMKRLLKFLKSTITHLK